MSAVKSEAEDRSKAERSEQPCKAHGNTERNAEAEGWSKDVSLAN